MNTGELIAGIVLIALSVLFYFSSRARKSQAAVIDSAPALNLNQPAQGRLYGKFQGVIVADQPIMTPYSSQPSVAWSAYLQREKREIDDDTSSTRTEWETVWSKSASTPFRLRAQASCGLTSVADCRPSTVGPRSTRTSMTGTTPSLLRTLPHADCLPSCPVPASTRSRRRSFQESRRSSWARSKLSTATGWLAAARARSTRRDLEE